MIVPWVLLLLLVTTVVLLLKKKWKIALLLLLAILAINWWSDCFCFGLKKSFSGDLKILSFNVNGQDINEHKIFSLISLIRQEDPDIFFLTEGYRPLEDSLFTSLFETYPYNTRKMSFNIIYSKYPIHKLQFIDRPNGGSANIVKCLVTVNDISLTLFGCHLSSNNYSSELDYLPPDKLDTFEEVNSYLLQTKNASHIREIEADTIASSLAGNEYVIAMGDMNDICGSTCIRKFNKAGLKDAWSEGGLGYGATIHHPLPYRIDHILYNDKLKLKGIKRIDTSDISDHDALVAVFNILHK